MFKSNTLLKLSNFVDNLITFAKLQQIGAYKTLANITGSTANLSEVNIGYTPNGAVTLSGDVTYAKSDFAGRTHLLLSATGSTRTFTVSNTGFTTGDFICLLIDQNSAQFVSVTIGTRSITNNRGNIINGLFDGTNWYVWSGGGVFNTISSALTSTSFGHSPRLGNGSTGFGNNVNVSGINSNAFGRSLAVSGNSSCGFGISTVVSAELSNAFGNSSSITGVNSNVIGSSGIANASDSNVVGYRANINSFARSNSFGSYTYNRRYGSTRFHLGTTTSETDATNPSLNGEKISWSGTTANSTITEIFLRGVSSNRCVLQAKNVLSFRGQCVAFRSDYTGSARWSIEGLIKRNSGNNTTLVGVTATLTHSDGTGDTLVLTIDEDDTNESLRVRVTGNASETWTWGVELELLDLRIA
jgi:hypothetical protein